jgi:prepilin-type processing-associated H-X9-DG protein
VTFIELLVVLGALALLVGLAVPALRGVTAGARGTVCLSNLRQLGAAAHHYAALFDAFPAAIRYEQRSGAFVRVAWDWVTTFDGQVISPGPLWGEGSDPGVVQQCPAYAGDADFSGDPHTGYNYNTTYLGAEGAFPLIGWEHVRRGVPPHACRRACTCAMFGDGGTAAGGTNKFMRAPSGAVEGSLSLVYAGGQALRHAGCTNVAFIDGHVEPVNRIFPGALGTAEHLEQYLGWPRSGFLSNDDSAYDPR